MAVLQVSKETFTWSSVPALVVYKRYHFMYTRSTKKGKDVFKDGSKAYQGLVKLKQKMSILGAQCPRLLFQWSKGLEEKLLEKKVNGMNGETGLTERYEEGKTDTSLISTLQKYQTHDVWKIIKTNWSPYRLTYKWIWGSSRWLEAKIPSSHQGESENVTAGRQPHLYTCHWRSSTAADTQNLFL